MTIRLFIILTSGMHCVIAARRKRDEERETKRTARAKENAASGNPTHSHCFCSFNPNTSDLFLHALLLLSHGEPDRTVRGEWVMFKPR